MANDVEWCWMMAHFSREHHQRWCFRWVWTTESWLGTKASADPYLPGACWWWKPSSTSSALTAFESLDVIWCVEIQPCRDPAVKHHGATVGDRFEISPHLFDCDKMWWTHYSQSMFLSWPFPRARCLEGVAVQVLNKERCSVHLVEPADVNNMRCVCP